MRQSNVIFGVLIFAFVIYITLRGQLPAYLSLFTGANTPANDTNNENKSADKTDPLESAHKGFNAVKNLSERYSNMGLM